MKITDTQDKTNYYCAIYCSLNLATLMKGITDLVPCHKVVIHSVNVNTWILTLQNNIFIAVCSLHFLLILGCIMHQQQLR